MTKEASQIVTRIVACGSCRACCIGDAVFLHPESGDDVASYETETAIHPITGDERRMLKHKANRECVYLDANGCSIHARRPAACREFDCGEIYARLAQLPRPERRRLQRPLSAPVIEAGRRQWLARQQS